MRGEMVDKIPFVPRLDLWWLANATKGTLPKKYEGMMPDDIARSEGWALYHMVPNFADISDPHDILHRSIGLFNFRQSVYGWRFSKDVEIKVTDNQGQQTVEYHTPLGMVRTVGGLTESAKRAGSSLGWVQEHVIKKPEDFRIIGYIFENLEVFPQYDGAREYIESIGEDGVAAIGGPSLGASPMHLIQKELIDSTQFFYAYNDTHGLVRELAEKIEIYYDNVLSIIADSPAEVVLWGGNYDDMLTYPPYFEKEILPWLQKVSRVLTAKGKIVATHTDGENMGLMDLIKNSGVHVAESVTPYPMTKVRIEEYYHAWRDKLTIMGGIPENILLKETADSETFERFLDTLFETVVPGDRLILGTADSTPPDAEFDRLLRIAERVEQDGRLPLKGKTRHVVGQTPEMKSAPVPESSIVGKNVFVEIMTDVVNGDEISLLTHVKELAERNVPAADIINRGMIPAMETIGEKFKTGDVFIPEVLLSARAMNSAMAFLEPLMTGEKARERKKILIGTVQGDMHDIGKNMVGIMLKGVGFEVKDIGINVAAEEFVRQVKTFKPDILGLSALLTTTMPEMKQVIDALAGSGMRNTVKILVGGAPVNRKYADDIGADGYAKDAGEAVEAAKRLLRLDT